MMGSSIDLRTSIESERTYNYLSDQRVEIEFHWKTMRQPIVNCQLRVQYRYGQFECCVNASLHLNYD